MQKGFIMPSIYVIFIALIVGSFFLGMKYSENRIRSTQTLDKQTLPKPTKKAETEKDLLNRCGDFPAEAYPKGDVGWTNINGPYWSPDCRHAVSTVSIIGRGLPPGIDAKNFVKGLNVPVGIHLYNDIKKTLSLINKDGYFNKWNDRFSFIFSVGDQKYDYSLVTEEITSIE